MPKSMDKIDFSKIKKIHFIGIGGIGVSAVARILLRKGFQVVGSDLTPSIVIEDLRKEGAEIRTGEHKDKNLASDVDLVVSSLAVKDNNPELRKAKKLRIPTLTYPQILSQLTKDYYLICISGTHGKTTTTSLVSLILEKAGLDPTCIIGSNLKEFRGNARVGKSKYFILEADEYRKAFLNYYPTVIILTNIEYEHPDCYQNEKEIIDTFVEYVKHLPSDGILIANIDDKNVKKVAERIQDRVITYGINSERAGIKAENIQFFKTATKFKVYKDGSEFDEFCIKIPGIHNVYNALAVIALGLKLEIRPEIIKEVLANFKGAWRRFEYKGKIKEKDVVVIDDYAHHPTEIKATIRGAKQSFPSRKIICIFQPHQIQRLKALFKNFVKAFSQADEVIISNVYTVPGRDVVADNKTDSKRLAEEIKKDGKNAKYIGCFGKIFEYLKKHLKGKEVIITMGAGDITKFSDMLVK